MKQVVIGMKDGKPYVISAPRKVEVIFKQPKRRSIAKRIRTLWWNIRHRTA